MSEAAAVAVAAVGKTVEQQHQQQQQQQQRRKPMFYMGAEDLPRDPPRGMSHDGASPSDSHALPMLHPPMERRQHQLVATPRSNPPTTYGWYWAGCFFLVVGETCSLLDLSRIWCNPTDHVVQGHAVWHLLTSVALLCQFLHYTQFENRTGRRAHGKWHDSGSVRTTAASTGDGMLHSSHRGTAIKSHRSANSVDVENHMPSMAASTSGSSRGFAKHRRNLSYDQLRWI